MGIKNSASENIIIVEPFQQFFFLMSSSGIVMCQGDLLDEKDLSLMSWIVVLCWTPGSGTFPNFLRLL